MKNIKAKELTSKIRKTKSSFISLFLFVLFGVTIFQGLGFAGEATSISMDNAFRNGQAYDLKVPTPNGIYQEQIDDFKNYEDIDYAEGTFTGYEYFDFNGNKLYASISSLTKDIDQIELVSGHKPETKQEILVLNSTANAYNIKVGDEIEFYDGNGMTNFITAQIREYGTEQQVKTDEISADNFINKKFTVAGIVRHPYYLSTSSMAYGISPVGSVQINVVCFVNYDSFNPLVTGNAYNNVVLKSNKLHNMRCYQKEYADAVANLVEEINPYINLISLEMYEKMSTNLEQIATEPILSEIIGLYLYSQGYITQEELEDANLLKQAIIKFGSNFVVDTDISALKRTDNVVFGTCDMMSTIANNSKWSLGGVFIVISFLICYSVITRLVNDDSKIIGTKKALGFRNIEITKFYIFYTLIAALLGILLGNAASMIVEVITTPILLMGMEFPIYAGYFDAVLAVVLLVILVGALSLITYLGCISILRKDAVNLLRGEEPPKGKVHFYQKGKLWKKLPLLTKTIINNIFHDRRRVFATIIGITCCSIMMVAVFSMKFNISIGSDKQFSEYFKYDTMVFFDSMGENTQSELQTYFDDHEIEASPIYREITTFTIEDNNQMTSFSMVYFDDESFNKLVCVDSINNVKFDNYGIWLQESIKRSYNCSDNPVVTLVNTLGATGENLVTGFYKCYTNEALCFMDADTYAASYQDEAKPNMFICKINGKSIVDLTSDLKNIKGFSSIYDYKAQTKSDRMLFDAASMIICLLYLIASACMSVFVILNLLNTFVLEKKKDLITLMINGYSTRQASRYIYVDTIILTVVSLVIGVFVGIVFGSFIISCFESNMMYLLHDPCGAACALGTAIVAVLVAIMCYLAIRKIKKFKLSEITTL